MNKNIQKISAWIFIIITITFIYRQVNRSDMAGNERIPFSEFMQSIEEKKIDYVLVKKKEIEGKYTNGKRFHTNGIIFESLIEKMHQNNIKFDIGSSESFGLFIINILLSWLPIFLLIGAWFMFMKQVQSGGNRALSFGKSKVKMFVNNKNKTTFQDIAGIDEAKEELVELVDFLKNPNKFTKLGGKIPKGCLLIGPPGTGKTLLAKAIAGEASVPFFSISGSDFVEMFVGVGASRVRDMFEQGKKYAPCIIFIDEIDAVGRHRGVGLGGGNDEREQTLNQLLVEMDGFNANQGVIIIAATNRPDVLDTALLRPGRFDRRITISIPDINGRTQILAIHSKKVPLAPDVDLEIIARATPGFSGADLHNLVNEGALIAARKNQKVVTMHNLEYAKDKVLMGIERKSLLMKEEEKKLTAYHEAGHAIVAINKAASDPIHKVTIMPRGHALGMVMRLPKDDRLSLNKEKILADLAVCMGGRVAEEIIFGKEKITSGASSDIKQASALARSMVMEWGMSEKAGLLFYGEDNDRMQTSKNYHNNYISDQTADLISSEVKKFVDYGHNEAMQIIKENIDSLHILAKALLKYETINGAEVKDLVSGIGIRKEEENKAPETKRTSSFFEHEDPKEEIKEDPEQTTNTEDKDDNTKN